MFQMQETLVQGSCFTATYSRYLECPLKL